jgi:hypothetical protein
MEKNLNETGKRGQQFDKYFTSKHPSLRLVLVVHTDILNIYWKHNMQNCAGL